MGIEDKEDEVKSRKQRVRQFYVLDDSLVLIPLRLDRVGSGQDRGTCVQLADDASLGDAQGLLFHHLVQHRPAHPSLQLDKHKLNKNVSHIIANWSKVPRPIKKRGY